MSSPAGDAAGDPPIVVSGGSVTLEFDEDQMAKTSRGKHHHPNKRIRRIEITGDGINFAEDTKTGKVTVKIFYKDKDK